MNRLKSLRNHGGVDRAFIYFDISADLETVFNWNVKQLFLFVVAEYESTTNKVNQVVIWDKIITEKENAKLELTNVPNKYYLTDQRDELRNTEITLSLRWDIMPITGVLAEHQQGNYTHTLPSKYK